MKNIKISVVVPVYNVEKFLKKCIDSILEQDFKEYELILINDGSTDSSFKIAKSYSDSRIVLINKENEGLSATRNLGINIAKGEYILHIDSDDWIEPNYLSALYNTAIVEKADIVIADYYIDYEGKLAIYRQVGRGKWKSDSISCVKKIIAGEINPSVWNKLIKRNLYIDKNIQHPVKISYGEDLAVTPRLLYYAKKIVKINKAFVHYRQNPTSITKTAKLDSIFELDECCKILEKFFNEKGISTNELWVNYMWFIYWYEDIFNHEKYNDIILRYVENCKKVQLKYVKSYRYKVYVSILKLFNSVLMLKILTRVERVLRKLKKLIMR